MKVLVTTLGRGHFVPAVSALVAAGEDAYLSIGWIVRNPETSKLVRLAMRLLKRGDSFVYGMRKRVIPELKGRCFGDFFAEFVETVVRLFFTRIMDSERGRHYASRVGFWLHGYRVSRLLRKTRFQVVHIRSGYGRGGVIKAAREGGVKILVDHSAGSPAFILGTVDPLHNASWNYWNAVQRDCEEADLLLVNSDWVKETFLMYGYPAEKIRVVYIGIDSWFNGLKEWDSDIVGIGSSPEKPLRIVYTGAFAPHKGNFDFLEAVEKMIEEGIEFAVDVVGSVSISPDVCNRFSKAVGKIRFHGHQSQDKMCEVMKQAHVYLFPSLSEGCARSALEAMSMGLCVLATKQSGLPMTNGRDGYLINVHDSDSIVERIKWLIAHADEIKKVGVRAIETGRLYTWENYAKNVRKIYKELVEGL